MATRMDSDAPPGSGSVTCASATIIAVVERGVQMSAKKRARIQFRGTTWADGLTVYDKNGYMLPNRTMRSLGITPQSLRRFGQWPIPPDVVNALNREGWRL